jgi:hypothetical protein
MNIKRKIRLFIALISLLYCVSLIQSTYAKYVTSADANANMAIARWNILLNTQDIKNNSDFTNNVTPVFAGNTNIAANIIAPTAEGYFDLIINGNSTDVSYSYTVTLSKATANTVTDLVIDRYNIDSSTSDTTFTGDTYTVTGNVLYNDTNKVHTIRVYVKWNDDTATQSMDNAADTAQTTSGKAVVSVNVNLIQLAS